MAKDKNIQIQLYTPSLSSPTLVEQSIDNYRNLSFSTKLHGGFGHCTFDLFNQSTAEAYNWAWKRLGYHLIVKDLAHDKTLFEGRIQGSPFKLNDNTINAFGYYSALKDKVYRTSYNTTGDAVIKAILTNEFSTVINSDQTNIISMDTTRDSSEDNDYLDRDCQTIIEYLLELGDSSKDKFQFAVWENRIPYLTKRNDSTINWYINAEDLNTNFELTPNFEDLYNEVYALYTSSGVLTRTSTAADADSIKRYGITRRYCISDLGEVSQANAEAVRDTFLAEHKDIVSSNSNLTLGAWVEDSKGRRYPSSHVRAGEVIQVRNILPSETDISNVRRNGINTFYILETLYSADSQTNNLTVDSARQTLDTMISKLISKTDSISKS